MRVDFSKNRAENLVKCKKQFLTGIAHKNGQGDSFELIKSLLNVAPANITLTPLVLLKKIQIFTVFLQKEKKGMNMTI